MRTRQTLCAIAALVLFLFAAGIIETHTGCGLALLALMPVPMYIGRLDKQRVSVRDIERRCGNAENG